MRQKISAVAATLGFAALMACSNAASRAGSDLEAGLELFEKSMAATYTIRYIPQLFPSGCSGRYRLQISLRGEITVWCRGAMDTEEGKTYVSPSPTHRVTVPHGFTIDKAAGENTYIDLAKQDGKIVITGLR